MRIAECSATRLVLKGGSAWVSIVCFLAAGLIGYASALGRAHGGLAGAGLFLLCGIALLRASRVELDRQARVLTLDKLKVFARRRVRVSFEDIDDVDIESDRLRSARVPQSRLVLATAQGRIALTDGFSPGYDSLVALRFAILEVLGKVASDALDRELHALVASRRTVAAITLLRSQKALDFRTARRRIEELEREIGGTKTAAGAKPAG